MGWNLGFEDIERRGGRHPVDPDGIRRGDQLLGPERDGETPMMQNSARGKRDHRIEPIVS